MLCCAAEAVQQDVSPAAAQEVWSELSAGVPVCLQAIWENQFYYLFGFLFLVFIILVVSCSQISIVMVYFQLCAEVSAVCSLTLEGISPANVSIFGSR